MDIDDFAFPRRVSVSPPLRNDGELQRWLDNFSRPGDRWIFHVGNQWVDSFMQIRYGCPNIKAVLMDCKIDACYDFNKLMGAL